MKKQPKQVTLTLTLKDAKALRAVSQHIGGLPTGPRGGFDRIINTLYEAGVPVPNTDRGVYKLEHRARGLYFK